MALAAAEHVQQRVAHLVRLEVASHELDEPIVRRLAMILLSARRLSRAALAVRRFEARELGALKRVPDEGGNQWQSEAISGKQRQAETTSELPNAYFCASLRWGLVTLRWKLAATRAQIIDCC